MSSLGNANDPLLILVLALAALVVVLLLRRKAPETHVQQASHGGSITHHHDARVSVVVTVERRERSIGRAHVSLRACSPRSLRSPMLSPKR